MWKPIINERKEQACFRDKIDDIYKSLLNNMDKVKDFPLYMGKSGICLFLAYYQAVNKQAECDLEQLVDAIINDAVQYKIHGYLEVTYYAEMAWLLCHLYEKKQIRFDLDECLAEIDDSLYEGMVLSLNNKEYGCVNGAISISLYFYYRYILGDVKYKPYLEQFVDLLRESAIETDTMMKWICEINSDTHEQGCNLGIAHGIPGILLFLRKLYLLNIKRNRISTMIVKICNFLWLQKHSLSDHPSYFYNVCTDTYGYDSKLGWCYGDLSVGYSLYQASSLPGLESNKIKGKVVEVLMSTTERTVSSNIPIVDAGLCHGTAGIAHLYDRLHHQTKEIRFKEAALYWYKETMRMAKFDSEYAGYRLPYYLKTSEKEISELHNLSFLPGIAGTGLSLLSAIYPIEPSWDMCLLLS